MPKRKKLKEVNKKNIVDVPEGSYMNIPFSGAELVSLIELLAASKGMFSILIEDCVKRNELEQMANYINGRKATELLHAKLAAFAQVGEPDKPLQH